MSDSNGPVNRRRIAGEGTAKKAVAKKAPVKKAAAKKVVKAPAVKAPAKKVPTVKPKAAVVEKAPAPRTPVASANGPGPTRRDLKWLIPSIAAALAALIVGVWLAVDGIQDVRNNDGDRASTEKAASSAASAAAETIFSYQYDKLDEHLTDSKKLMTSKFAKDFEKIAPALDDIAPQRRVQVEAVGRNAAALSCGDECSPGTVNVLIFLDQARLIDGSKEPDVIGNRITMKMVHRDGQWLVDDIRAV
ncbi:hypothetical protein J2X11_002647 [Aeromicrobium panaciterrae]|uniref:Mce-associated membrane protein n=1 Tax=Aeromicrobium panaciterrae TaxID=363861 RepID=A0ABU1URP5_9ACTN|nr:hypothetical protein [Aeromicrobium panaciterrae]MDR7087808.1 hypothetical protein [Aeromicrobium panaciterrae]